MASVLKFLFEVITDFSVVPSLMLILQRKRHFEFFIGVFQMVVSLLYNLSDAFGVQLFLKNADWHRLTNVAGLAYGLNVLIFLMRNEDEALDHILRYSGFAAIWIAQIKDDFWMHETQWTLYVLFLFGFFCVVRTVSRRKQAFEGLSKRRILWGVVFSALAGVLFVISLDDAHDSFRFWHGMSQIFFGAALWNLWQVHSARYGQNIIKLPL